MIDLKNPQINSSGIVTREIASTINDERGVNAVFDIELPEFEKVVYYCAPQSHWPVACCRMHSFVTDDLNKLFEGGIFILVKTSSGYLGILPLAFEDYFCWLDPEKGQLKLRVGTMGTEDMSGEKALCSWALSEDPYEVIAETFKLAADTITSFKLREDKEYAEMFKHLGWCSWEEYNLTINSKLLCETVDKINNSCAPVRYMLVDDGHQNYDPADEYFMRRLKSYYPNAEKFPAGYSPLLDKGSDNGVKWFGLWFPFMGGMIGINPDDNKMGELNDKLITLSTGGAMPKDDQSAANDFMNGLLGGAAGFDFIKVDFMTFPIAFYAGVTEWQNALKNKARKPIANPHRASWRMNRALEEQLGVQNLQLLNCNAQGPFNFFNASCSNASRCSCDYSKGNPAKAREHLFQSYGNTPWQGQFTWCDHDMFHSSDELAGRMMAVSKALSGGPVYLSDAPDDFLKDNIMPLCYEDGKLLRPLAPAAPLADSLFLEYPTAAVEEIPSTDNLHPYRVIAPLANNAAALAVYHLADTEESMQAEICVDDYRHADIMIQPYPGLRAIPTDGLIVWDWYDKCAFKLDNAYEFELQPLEDRLLILSPVQHGWSILGRFDKYLGPAAVEVLEIDSETVTLRITESGPLAIWLTEGTPVAEGLIFKPHSGGLHVADMAIGEKQKKITLTRTL
jgi:Raffinose synthase or seed imbibition protein Sip1